MPLHTPDLRVRMQQNLDAFERLPAPDLGSRRHSAVALCVMPNEAGEASFVITRRAPKLKAHAGQLALPGGRIDSGETPPEAALREMREEVGLALAPDDVLGVLDDYPTRSGFVVTPVVVWCSEATELRPNPGEVSSVTLIPIAELEQPEAPRLVAIPESDRPVIQMPVLGHWIHAPTAAVLHQFVEVALRGRPTRVAEYEQPVWAWR